MTTTHKPDYSYIPADKGLPVYQRGDTVPKSLQRFRNEHAILQEESLLEYEDVEETFNVMETNKACYIIRPYHSSDQEDGVQYHNHGVPYHIGPISKEGSPLEPSAYDNGVLFCAGNVAASDESSVQENVTNFLSLINDLKSLWGDNVLPKRIIFPIFYSNHYVLLAVDTTDRTIVAYDPTMSVGYYDINIKPYIEQLASVFPGYSLCAYAEEYQNASQSKLAVQGAESANDCLVHCAKLAEEMIMYPNTPIDMVLRAFTYYVGKAEYGADGKRFRSYFSNVGRPAFYEDESIMQPQSLFSDSEIGTIFNSKINIEEERKQYRTTSMHNKLLELNDLLYPKVQNLQKNKTSLLTYLEQQNDIILNLFTLRRIVEGLCEFSTFKPSNKVDQGNLAYIIANRFVLTGKEVDSQKNREIFELYISKKNANTYECVHGLLEAHNEYGQSYFSSKYLRCYLNKHSKSMNANLVKLLNGHIQILKKGEENPTYNPFGLPDENLYIGVLNDVITGVVEAFSKYDNVSYDNLYLMEVFVNSIRDILSLRAREGELLAFEIEKLEECLLNRGQESTLCPLVKSCIKVTRDIKETGNLAFIKLYEFVRDFDENNPQNNEKIEDLLTELKGSRGLDFPMLAYALVHLATKNGVWECLLRLLPQIDEKEVLNSGVLRPLLSEEFIKQLEGEHCLPKAPVSFEKHEMIELDDDTPMKTGVDKHEEKPQGISVNTHNLGAIPASKYIFKKEKTISTDSTVSHNKGLLVEPRKAVKEDRKYHGFVVEAEGKELGFNEINDKLIDDILKSLIEKAKEKVLKHFRDFNDRDVYFAMRFSKEYGSMCSMKASVINTKKKDFSAEKDGILKFYPPGKIKYAQAFSYYLQKSAQDGCEIGGFNDEYEYENIKYHLKTRGDSCKKNTPIRTGRIPEDIISKYEPKAIEAVNRVASVREA